MVYGCNTGAVRNQSQTPLTSSNIGLLETRCVNQIISSVSH